MAVEYGPKRLNSVTVVLILIAAVIAYCCYVFLPAYFDSWTVDHTLRESANECYRVARLAEPQRTKSLTAIAEKARLEIVKKGNVNDPNLEVGLDLGETKVTMSADYHVVVKHPFVNRTTTLHFHLVEGSSTKQVKWD